MLNFLEEWELSKIMEASISCPPYVRPILGLMAYAGLRISEACHLTVRDVLVNGQVVRVLTIPAGITKTNKSRQLPLPEVLINILHNYIFKTSKLGNEAHWLFPGMKTGPLTSRAIWNWVFSLGQKTIDRAISPHTFRHTYATLLYRRAPLRVVQEALGHRTIQSTQIYTHVTRSDIEKAVNEAFPQPQKPKGPYSIWPTEDVT